MSPKNSLHLGAFWSSVTPPLSVTFHRVTLSASLVTDTILLKKKVGEEIATLLPPPSFDGTDKPRAPFITQSGGLA